MTAKCVDTTTPSPAPRAVCCSKLLTIKLIVDHSYDRVIKTLRAEIEILMQLKCFNCPLARTIYRVGPCSPWLSKQFCSIYWFLQCIIHY